MPEMILDPKQLHVKIQTLSDKLNAKVIGQERAIKQIIKAFVPMTVNMHRDGRPLGVFLFLGPTGVGKTETVRTFANLQLGNRSALTRVDCAEFDSSHQVSKLIGAPPGYLGYGDDPVLSQKKIDQYQTKESKINIVLFDELEKAHERLFDAIMTIMGDGRLTLGNGKLVDFTKSFIFLTSNLGSDAVRRMVEGKGIGFNPSTSERDQMDESVYKMAKEAVKKQFRPEFINRLDSTVVFRSLDRDSLRKILKIELHDLQWRIWSSPWKDFSGFSSGDPMPEGRSIVFKLTDEAKDFLLDEGTSELYGARELNRVIDRFVGFPMAALISSEQLATGDMVRIGFDADAKDLTFTKVDKP